MLPWRRIWEDLRTGLERFRRGTLTAPGLAAEEMNILKLTLELRKLDERLGELYGEVGKRVYEKLKARGSFEVKDAEVDALCKEIGKQMSSREKVWTEREELRRPESHESLSEL